MFLHLSCQACGKYEELTGRKELGIIIHENPRYGIFALSLFLNDFFGKNNIHPCCMWYSIIVDYTCIWYVIKLRVSCIITTFYLYLYQNPCELVELYSFFQN
jgi:hypothetical protein